MTHPHPERLVLLELIEALYDRFSDNDDYIISAKLDELKAEMEKMLE